MTEYYRIKFSIPEGKTRWAYVTELGRLSLTNPDNEAYQVVNKQGEDVNEIIIAAESDVLVCKPMDMNLKYAELEFAPVCSECAAGEIYYERAVAKVRHPNCDTYSPAPPITKNVCEGHEHMLATDYGDDLQVLEIFQGGK